MKSYLEHKNDHDYFSDEHIANFLRQHRTGVDNAGRQYLGHIIRQYNYESVLDVACGSCVNYETWKLMGIPVQYCGFDLTQKLLNEADKRYGTEVNLVHGHAQELDTYFGTNQFDVVIIRHLLEHLPNGDYQDIIRKALTIADKELIVVFFLEPHSGPEDLVQENSSNIEGHPEVTHYWNHYSHNKLMSFFSQLNIKFLSCEVKTPGAAHSDYIYRLIK